MIIIYDACAAYPNLFFELDHDHHIGREELCILVNRRIVYIYNIYGILKLLLANIGKLKDQIFFPKEKNTTRNIFVVISQKKLENAINCLLLKVIIN